MQPISEAENRREDVRPDLIAGYRIIRLLGEGGMGRVYLAREQHPPRDVALKLIHSLQPQAQQRFRREAELLAGLQHPGIARLYAAGEAELGGLRLPWLALEYVDGSDLVAHADAHAAGLPARVRLLVAVCRAVQHAHGRGVIHRDLKPGNILVDADGVPRVLDFGIARLHGDGDGMTAAGQVLGTLPYMAPELLEHGGRGDVSADVYALGVIAYELIARRLPHPRLSTSTLFEALDIVRRETPRPLGELAPAARGDLACVVMKALAADPLRRYASAAEFAADLERVLEHRPVDARPPSAAYLLGRLVRRNPALTSAAFGVLLVVLAASVVSLRFAWSEHAARAEAERRAAEADAVSGFLQQMLESADPEQALGRDLRVRDVLDPAASGLLVAELPEAVRSALLATLARTYTRLGDGDRALPLLERARVAADRTQHVALQLATADAQIVVDRFEPALATLATLDADVDDPLSALRVAQLRSHALAGLGTLEEAEQVLREALARFADAVPAHDRTVLGVRHNLSAVLQQRGQLDDAEALTRDVLAARRATFGSDDPETLVSQNHLAALQQLRGEPEAAEALMRETITDRARVLGEQHPSTLISKANLAVLLIRGGRLPEAVELLRALVDAWRSIRGEHAVRTLLAKSQLAYALEDLGQLDEAEALQRAIVTTQLAEGGPRDPSVLSARNDLGMLLMKRGRLDDALVELDGAIVWAEQLLGTDHAYTTIMRGNRGECLARLGRLTDAREVLERAHRALQDAFGADHPRTRTAAERLAAVLERLGDAAAARAVRSGTGA